MLLKRLGLELVLVGLVIALGAVTWDLSYVLGQPVEHHQGEEAAVFAHNTIATIVVIAGVVLAAFGARMLLLGKPASRQAYALFAASSLMLADGILHFYVVSEHLSILSFAVFFVVAGAVQLVLGFGLFRAKPLVYLFSVLVLIGLVVVFFVTRVVPPPGVTEPEQFEAVGVVSKLLEFGALGALGYLMYRWRSVARQAESMSTGAPQK